ncbi:hypothetical protein CUMW_077810 [Citrus unshiu]|nr:hypothetical protein CUMW_077810 [Citrus unshiu]
MEVLVNSYHHQAYNPQEVISYQKRMNRASYVPNFIPLKQKIGKSKVLVKSFSPAKDIKISGQKAHPSEESELQAVAEFLESDIAAPGFQEYEMSLRLMQMGAAVRNSSSYLRMKLNPDKMLPSNLLEESSNFIVFTKCYICLIN